MALEVRVKKLFSEGLYGSAVAQRVLRRWLPVGVDLLVSMCGAGRPVGTVETFLTAAGARQSGGVARPGGGPGALSRACVKALPVVGAGFGLFDGAGFVTPVAVSDAMAATAERAQFTVGHGPSFDALGAGRVVVAPEAIMAERWPMLHRSFVERTDIRAMVCVPLNGALTGTGLLDLYCRSSADVDALDLMAVRVIAEVIETSVGRWIHDVMVGGDAAAALLAGIGRFRSRVPIAVGMLRFSAAVGSNDALALLRAYAFREGTSVDAVAGQLVDGALSASAITKDC